MEGTLQGALLAALLFGGYQASGLCLARLALPGEGPGVRLLVGSVWGSVLLQWLPALLAFAVGFTPLAQWLGLGIALALAAKRREIAGLAHFFEPGVHQRFHMAFAACAWMYRYRPDKARPQGIAADRKRLGQARNLRTQPSVLRNGYFMDKSVIFIL